MVKKLSIESKKTDSGQLVQKAVIKEQEEKPNFVTSAQKGLETPIVPLRFCYLNKPYFYPGAHVGRYSCTLSFDRSITEDRKFLEQIEKIAIEKKVPNMGYAHRGCIHLKFQSKEPVKIFAMTPGKKKPEPVVLDRDFPDGQKIKVKFDLNVYYNKKTKSNAFNFSPTEAILYFEEELKVVNKTEQTKVKTVNEDSKKQSAGDKPKKGSDKRIRNRPKSTSHRLGSSKFRPKIKGSVDE